MIRYRRDQEQNQSYFREIEGVSSALLLKQKSVDEMSSYFEGKVSRATMTLVLNKCDRTK